MNKSEKVWIPCSQRLPDEDGIYLAQNCIGNINVLGYVDGWNCYRMPITNEVVRDYEIHSIVAWMPLPEPYRGEKV